ncbi:LacI family DNA-binding transcriptional regulator [Pengzhenrongella sicca]|uniref:LacI family DNA-binding transcriptional regulator n=1 Tax=Pengzhenrongella sicca TaxID=2819238 RepID=A0A8A4ZCI3_9MICO|nr:LacI family DNA-binding transcriptional regulator [Pengzhenrongella sicca]QTE29594.1 LacI family DNA-binding transcriptional regulator [Pengzhenrongella sicca]
MAHGIDEVARVAGVSTATVSRALRGLPNVSDSTRERVRSVATQLGYVASPSAASLASGRTMTIGLLTPWVKHWFFANVIEGAERALQSEGFGALLYTFEISRNAPRRRVDPDVLRRRVDGILVVGLPLDPAEVAALVGLGHPMIFVGSGVEGQLTVRLDDLVTGRTATEHLIDLGHRRIGHISGAPDDVTPFSPPAARRRGWLEAMGAAGLSVEPTLEVHGHFDLDGGRDSMRQLLAQRPDVTAVFAASDEMAMGAILAVRELGLRVPQDVSVIGIDGHDLGELVGLTTMAHPAVEEGAAAAALLLTMIAGTSAPADLVYQTRLVRRSSTGPPREGVAHA